jgi:hypothetical protein
MHAGSGSISVGFADPEEQGTCHVASRRNVLLFNNLLKYMVFRACQQGCPLPKILAWKDAVLPIGTAFCCAMAGKGVFRTSVFPEKIVFCEEIWYADALIFKQARDMGSGQSP